MMKRHTAENGSRGSWVISTEAIVVVLAVFGVGGGFSVGHITNDGASTQAVEDIVRAVHNAEETTWTIDELAERDAQLEADRADKQAVQIQIDDIEEDVTGLKREVGDISAAVKEIKNVQAYIAEAVGAAAGD